MSQQKTARKEWLISILGTVKGNETDNVLARLNRFHLLMIVDKDEHIIVNIPAWPLVVALIVLLVSRRVGRSA